MLQTEVMLTSELQSVRIKATLHQKHDASNKIKTPKRHKFKKKIKSLAK